MKVQLDQPKFIWTMNNVHASGKVQQNGTSEVKVDLRPQVQISHDYRKNNRTTITFKDDGVTFIIPDHTDLEEICRIHLMNKDAVQILREHCEKYLTKV